MNATDATALDNFTAAMEQAHRRAEAFDALGRLVATTVGAKLFTVMTMDFDAGLARRAWSNEPAAYPVSGDKRIERNAWFEQVHDRGESFVANTIAEIDAVFPDAETIASLGCGSVLNIPVRVGGRILGTMNLLDAEGYFDAATVTRCERLLRLPGLACFLLD